MYNTLLGIPVEFWTVGCFAIAFVYGSFWPRPPRTSTTPRTIWQQVVLRWFHAATWLCLGLASLSLKYVGATAAQVLGVLGFLGYITFMVVFVREKFRYPQG